MIFLTIKKKKITLTTPYCKYSVGMSGNHNPQKKKTQAH